MEKTIELKATFNLELYCENEEQAKEKLSIITHVINQMYADVKVVKLAGYKISVWSKIQEIIDTCKKLDGKGK